MHLFWKNNKKFLKLIIWVLTIGLILGIGYFLFLNSDIKVQITETLQNYNNYRYNGILKDLIIMSFLLVLSIFVVGIPLQILFVLYEGISLGFLLSIFSANFGISGLTYGLLFIIFNKLITFLFMIYFIRKNLNISKYILSLIIYRKDNLATKKLFQNFYSALLIIIIVFLINLLIYYISPIIFLKLSFLLK